MEEDNVKKKPETTKSNAASVSANTFSGIPIGPLISAPIIAAAEGTKALNESLLSKGPIPELAEDKGNSELPELSELSSPNKEKI